MSGSEGERATTYEEYRRSKRLAAEEKNKATKEDVNTVGHASFTISDKLYNDSLHVLALNWSGEWVQAVKGHSYLAWSMLKQDDADKKYGPESGAAISATFDCKCDGIKEWSQRRRCPQRIALDFTVERFGSGTSIRIGASGKSAVDRPKKDDKAAPPALLEETAPVYPGEL